MKIYTDFETLKSDLADDILLKSKLVFINRTQSYYCEILDKRIDIEFTMFKSKDYYKKFHPLIEFDIKQVTKLLKEDLTSRRAIISFWGPGCYFEKMPPCFTQVHFLIRNNTLHTFIAQRSMEFKFLPQDISFFSFLTEEIKKSLNLDAYRTIMHFNISSFHKEVKGFK